MSVLKPSLSYVVSLDTRREWSIVVPTFDVRSLMRYVTIVSNFYMRLRSYGAILWHSYGCVSGIILDNSCTRPPGEEFGVMKDSGESPSIVELSKIFYCFLIAFLIKALPDY